MGFFGHFIEKVECWPPQPRKKCKKEWFNQKIPLRTFRTLAKSCPHAKFWPISLNSLRDPDRTWPFLQVTFYFQRQGPYPALAGLLREEMHDHLGGRGGQEQVFASGQVFLFYRRVHCVNLCEVWFLCYIAISSTEINLFEHCCSSHNRSLAFVISRQSLERAGPGEHGVANFKSKKHTSQKNLISKAKQIEILLSQEKSETILGQNGMNLNSVFVKKFQKAEVK